MKSKLLWEKSQSTSSQQITARCDLVDQSFSFLFSLKLHAKNWDVSVIKWLATL